jgi:sugar phosphate isomerase/epimerase
MKAPTGMSIRLFTLLILSIAFQFTSAQEIGIQMGSMRAMYKDGMPAVLARLKELGIKELEGGSPRGTKREDFKKLLEQYGMKIVAVGGNFERLQNKDSIQKIITNAKELGAQYVVCYWIPHDGDNFTYADMQKGVEVFNEAGKTLKENGLALTYHPHGYEFREYKEGKGTLFEYMMEKTNPEYINFQMDVFWIKNPGQDPVALLKKYPHPLEDVAP